MEVQAVTRRKMSFTSLLGSLKFEVTESERQRNVTLCVAFAPLLVNYKYFVKSEKEKKRARTPERKR